MVNLYSTETPPIPVLHARILHRHSTQSGVLPSREGLKLGVWLAPCTCYSHQPLDKGGKRLWFFLPHSQALILFSTWTLSEGAVHWGCDDCSNLQASPASAWPKDPREVTSRLWASGNEHKLVLHPGHPTRSQTHSVHMDFTFQSLAQGTPQMRKPCSGPSNTATCAENSPSLLHVSALGTPSHHSLRLRPEASSLAVCM